MTVTLPTSPFYADYRAFAVSSGGIEASPLGGTSQNILRPGDRWGLEVSLPPMGAGDVALNWVAALNLGRTESVITEFPQIGLLPGTPGPIRVNGPGQSGMVLNVDGATANYVARSGAFFSFVKGGRTYLHQVYNNQNFSAGGVAALTLVNPLRVQPDDNALIEFVAPKIEGWLESNQSGWAVDRLRTYGLTFTVVEK
jgi:hypothetical protein